MSIEEGRKKRRRGFEALLARAEGNAPAMAALSRLLRTDGWKEAAADLAARALALAPQDAEVRAMVQGYETAGLLAAGRALVILEGEVLASERP